MSIEPGPNRSHRYHRGASPGLNGIDFLNGIAPARRWLAVGILLAGLIGTLFASIYVKDEVETAALNEFDFICNEITLNIEDRLAASALTLYSGRALFYSSDEVTRAEWKIFTDELRLEQQIPGTQGIGFSLIIPPNQLEKHIEQVRKEGFPEYTVRPENPRQIYTSIVYLEPFIDRNLRAFGFDMYSEPVRRDAMERARDTDMAALSGKVVLVQETNEDVQAGTLMYVPVYRSALPISTVEERRASIVGWVYSPYRMNDLMSGTLGNYAFKQGDRHITVQIFDGDEMTTGALLFDSRNEEEKTLADASPELSKVVRVNLYGRLWTLKFAQLGGLASIADYGSLRLVLLAGISISVLLFGLVVSLFRTAHYLESIQLLAETDSLTGVLNRRKILDLAENELLRARRHRHNLTILMIDLNFFKHINDTYGHAVGDKALCLAARALQNSLRKDIDQIGRFGGDEFIILLPETGLDKLEPLTRRLRVNVAGETAQIANGLRPVSLSIGAAALDGTTHSLHDLIEVADRAMYADKKLAKM